MFDGVRSPIPWLNTTNNSNFVPFSNANGFASKSHNIGSQFHLVSPRSFSAIDTSGYMNGMYSNKLYGQYKGACGSQYQQRWHIYAITFKSFKKLDELPIIVTISFCLC
ncbi:hypothetical protein Hanom_Chr14g01304011 [Helianthus anomalus]